MFLSHHYLAVDGGPRHIVKASEASAPRWSIRADPGGANGGDAVPADGRGRETEDEGDAVMDDEEGDDDADEQGEAAAVERPPEVGGATGGAAGGAGAVPSLEAIRNGEIAWQSILDLRSKDQSSEHTVTWSQGVLDSTVW